jgi:hypothetical protein
MGGAERDGGRLAMVGVASAAGGPSADGANNDSIPPAAAVATGARGATGAGAMAGVDDVRETGAGLAVAAGALIAGRGRGSGIWPLGGPA